MARRSAQAGLERHTFRPPSGHRQALRFSIGVYMERVNREIKRRTRVATLLPNAASAPRLVSTVLMEFSQDRETAKTYLTMEPK
jgi:transposase-like protein